MIAMFIIASAPLVHDFQAARDQLWIASPSIYDDRIVHSIGVATRNGANASVLLAPTVPEAAGDDSSQIGVDPYAGTEDEFHALKAARADVFIDPRFNAAGARAMQYKKRSRMSFAVMGTGLRSPRVSIICTGPMDETTFAAAQDVCLASDSPDIHSALNALHRADFNDTIPPKLRANLVEIAGYHLVLSPGGAQKVRDLLSDSVGPVSIASESIDVGCPLFDDIVSLGGRVTLTVPIHDGKYEPAIAILSARGVKIIRTKRSFDGSMVLTSNKLFLGSQSFTRDGFAHTRNVGLIVAIKDVDQVVMLGERK